MKRKIITAAMLASALTACGGGSSSSGNGGSNAVSGKVIDGYVSGATVFLDINGDGQYNNGFEPMTVSGSAGDYQWELSDDQAKCLNLVPTIVDVPVGAIDEELGRVLEPYRMVLPPKFNEAVDYDKRHITPLTSMLWNAVALEIHMEGEPLTCDDLQKDNVKRERYFQILEQSMADMTRHYNLSEDKLYDDFIYGKDSETQVLAEEIVRGLQKSYIDTTAMLKANPDADWVNVSYYLRDHVAAGSVEGEDATKRVWYRDMYTYTGSTLVSVFDVMSDDLSDVKYHRMYAESTSKHFEWGEYLVRTELFYSAPDGNEITYAQSCNQSEELSLYENGKGYMLVNLAEVSTGVQSYADCKAVDYVAAATGRYKFIHTLNTETENPYDYVTSSQHSYWAGNISDLLEFINMADKVETLDRSVLVRNFNQLSHQYNENILNGANSVNKVKIYQDGGNSVRETKDYSMDPDSASGLLINYMKTTTYSDGTWKTEISNDGVHWVSN